MKTSQDHSILFAGALLCALSVGIGAFGAHGLKDILAATGYTDVFETAVRYQFFHSIGLLVLSVLPIKAKRTVATLLGIGILIFSGSLYILSTTGIRWLGAITPIGGVSFIAAWLLIAWQALKQPKSV